MKQFLVHGIPHSKQKLSGVLAAAVLGVAMAVSTTPAFAVLNADSCKKIAETAVGVYDLAVKGGATHADAAKTAQANFMRRVREEGGPAPSSMRDDIDDCKGAGMGVAALCRIIAPFYGAAPC